MSTIERRALYTLVRMLWLREPTLPAEPWQVEDYRALSLPLLFDRLRTFAIHLDRMHYIAHADACDSPEELTEYLLADRRLDPAQEDQVYLLLFELWRRLITEKPSLSILCHELDERIFLHDAGEEQNPLLLQDSLTRFLGLLEENVDQGIPPAEAFQLISGYFANDLEAFLYDYTVEQLEGGDEAYARELLERLAPHVTQNKWFNLLFVRLCGPMRLKKAHEMIAEILERGLDADDLDYHLELLSVIAEKKDPSDFSLVMQHTLPLIRCEEDLQELLAIAVDYCRSLGRQGEEMEWQHRLNNRSSLPLNQAIDPQDRDLVALSSIPA